MSLPSQIPTLSYDSRSSSFYSEDEMVSEVNSDGTQIHHRSHLRPTIGGIPRENEQTFERSSDLSLCQDNPMQNQDGSAPNLNGVNVSNLQYRFETPTEAALRHLEERSRVHASKDANERRKHLQVWEKGLLQDCAQEHFQEVDRMRLSPYSSSCDDENSARYLSEPYLSGSSTSSVHLRTQQVPVCHFSPLSPTTCDVNTGGLVETEDELMKIYLEGLKNTEPQGSMELRNNPLDSRLFEADAPSTSKQEYGLGDYMRGYINGNYVTELETLEEPQQEKCKKRDLVKSFFCLRR